MRASGASMERLTRQRQALGEIRTLLGRFVRAELDVATFVPSYQRLFAPFDPPDLATAELSDAERAELALFIQLMGGWFGEDDPLVPKASDWQYGKDDRPYGWIDPDAYRRWIASSTRAAGIVL